MAAFEIGVLVHLKDNTDLFGPVAKMGMKTCQLCCWNMSLYSQEMAQKVKIQSQKHNITITAVWAGWTGSCVWDFIQGPATLGIVPIELRDTRIAQLKQGADFAKML
ncbi:MAG: sugar phosphate isomerase/epimerase, partial [Phycisphaerales bacterium]